MTKHSVTYLIDMLKTACREGIEAVPDAPPELATFIGAMEAAPAWIDFDLVRDGARQERIPAALLAPFSTRGAFVATFTNTYAALPMALTGALSGKRAARASTRRPVSSPLPPCLARWTDMDPASKPPPWSVDALDGPLQRPEEIRQMGYSHLRHAGAAGRPDARGNDRPYLLDPQSRQQGRSEFTAEERAAIEIRQVSLLSAWPAGGLLPPNPPTSCTSCTRAQHFYGTDSTPFAVNSFGGTMAAYLRPNTTAFDRCAEAVEKSFSKLTFVRTFCNA